MKTCTYEYVYNLSSIYFVFYIFYNHSKDMFYVNKKNLKSEKNHIKIKIKLKGKK